MVWFKIKELQKAIDDLTKVIGLDPSDKRKSQVLVMRGEAFAILGKTIEALADFEKSITVDPQNAIAYADLGDIWGKQKKYEKAVQFYGSAIDLKPKDNRFLSDCLAKRAYAFMVQNQFTKAESDYSTAIKLSPDKKSLYTYRGINWIRLKKFDKALYDFNKAMDLKPVQGNDYFWRAAAEMELKKLDKAIADFSEAIKLDPENIKYYCTRGQAWVKKGEYGKAYTDFDIAIRLNSKDDKSLVMNAYAWFLATNPEVEYRDGKKAVGLAKEALQIKQNDPAFLDTLAAAYAEAGDYDHAVITQKRVIDIMTRHKAMASMLEGAHQRLDLYERHQPYRDL